MSLVPAIPLAVCPDTPKCVSTVEVQPSSSMEVLPFRGDMATAKKRLQMVMAGLERTRLVKEEDVFLHYEVGSRWLNFVDDVEFYFDQHRQVIHFRSASRQGYYDFGVNRKRMAGVGETYKKMP